MQIHEITEGLFNTLVGAATGNFAGSAQDAAAKLQKQGYGTSYQPVDANKIWPEKLKTVQTDPAVQKYINGLLAAWQQQSNTTTNEANDLSTIRPATTGGPTPADRAKLAKKIQAAKAASEPAELEKSPFETWTDAQLLSRVPGTGEQITMDEVRQLSGLGPQLARALEKVIASQGTPAAAAAMKEYLELAIAGIQARSQESKSKLGARAKLSGKYAKSTGNAQADSVLKAAGFKVS
jgi:hypothetical protein